MSNICSILDMAAINQATPVIVPLRENQRYDLNGLLNGITDEIKMIVICNSTNLMLCSVSVGKQEENELFIEHMKEVMKVLV